MLLKIKYKQENHMKNLIRISCLIFLLALLSLQTIAFAQDSITIISPQNGGLWYKGETMEIKWLYAGPYVDIELLKNDSSFDPPQYLAETFPTNVNGVGSFNWTVPSDLDPGIDYKIKITSSTDSTINAASTFTIEESLITVVAPNGGEAWSAGDTSRQISWTKDPGITTVNIELLTEFGGSVETIDENVDGTTYSWSIPKTLLSGKYKIGISGTVDGRLVQDSSDSSFTITGNSVTVTSPNGGETVYQGDIVTINWSYQGDPGANVKIELRNSANTSTVATIIASASKGSKGIGSYKWTVPGTIAGDYNIRVSSTTNTGINDTSDDPFEVSEPEIELSSCQFDPYYDDYTLGSAFQGGTYTISWNYKGNFGSNVKIELWDEYGDILVDKYGLPINDPDSDFIPVLATTYSKGKNGTGSYKWTIPSTLDAIVYSIKISSQDKPSISSDCSIDIYWPGITLVSPGYPADGDETLSENVYQGDSYTIKWNYDGNIGSTVAIAIYDENDVELLNKTTSSGKNGIGSYSWKIPLGYEGIYWVVVTSLSDEFIFDFNPVIINKPVITVLSPDEGEEWSIGDAKEIKWSYQGNPGASVKIELRNSADTATIATIKTPTSTGKNGVGTYKWTIPTTGTGAVSPGDYKIRVSSTTDPTITHTSSLFTIKNPAITVITPNGGEEWYIGDVKEIKWSYQGDPGSNVKIDLLNSSDTLVATIKTPTSKGKNGMGSYKWTIPATGTSAVSPGDYKIRVSSTNTTGITGTADTSDATFTIKTPEITVITPNGGEAWGIGDTQEIKWSYKGDPGRSVKIDLKDSTDTTIITNITKTTSTGKNGVGTYKWKIPTTVTPGDYKIKVSSTNTTGIIGTADTSDATFEAVLLLKVVLKGNGNGTVTSDPAGISCGADCTQGYMSSTSVTLTAAPESGSLFKGWSDGCTGTALTCTVTVDKSKTVTATFTALTPLQSGKNFISDLKNTLLAIYNDDEVGLPGILKTPFTNISDTINTFIAPEITQLVNKEKWIIESSDSEPDSNYGPDTFYSDYFPDYTLTLTKEEVKGEYDLFTFTIKDPDQNTVDSGTLNILKDSSDNVKYGSIAIQGSINTKFDFTTTITNNIVTSVIGTGFISIPDPDLPEQNLLYADFSQNGRSLSASFAKNPASDPDMALYPTTVSISTEATSSFLKMNGSLSISSAWATKAELNCQEDEFGVETCVCDGNIRPKSITFTGSLEELDAGVPTGLKYNGKVSAEWTNAVAYNGCADESSTNYAKWKSNFTGTLEAPSYYKTTANLGISQSSYGVLSLTADYSWTKGSGTVITLKGSGTYDMTKDIWSGSFKNQNSLTLSFTFDKHKSRDSKLSGSITTSSKVKVADIYTLYGLPMVKYTDGYFESIF
jgi:5-hydroxyisourate hydrolase-like protein (transthyretin family)